MTVSRSFLSLAVQLFLQIGGDCNDPNFPPFKMSWRVGRCATMSISDEFVWLVR